MSVTNQKSTQATNHDAVPKVQLDWYDLGFTVHGARVTSTQSGAGDANSTMLLQYVPANKLILPHLSKLYTTDFGTGETLDVGTATDEDLFASAVDVATAATSFYLDEAHDISAAATDLSNGVLTTAETAIYAKCEAAAYTDGAKVNGFIYFGEPK